MQVILIKGQQCAWQCAIAVGCKHTRHSRGNEQARQGSLANTLIAFHLPPPLVSLGFRGNALFSLPYVAEVCTRYPRGFFGANIRSGKAMGGGVGGVERHTFTRLSGVIFMKYQ